MSDPLVHLFRATFVLRDPREGWKESALAHWASAGRTEVLSIWRKLAMIALKLEMCEGRSLAGEEAVGMLRAQLARAL